MPDCTGFFKQGVQNAAGPQAPAAADRQGERRAPAAAHRAEGPRERGDVPEDGGAPRRGRPAPRAPGQEACAVLSPRPETVLLIDDDPQWAALVRVLLPHEWPPPAFALTVATSLEAGLAVLERASVDLILLDLALPGCTDLRA